MGEWLMVAMCFISAASGAWWTYFLCKKRDAGHVGLFATQANIIDGLNKIIGDFCKEMQIIQKTALAHVAEIKTQIVQVPIGSASTSAVPLSAEVGDDEIRRRVREDEHIQYLKNHGVLLAEPDELGNGEV